MFSTMTAWTRGLPSTRTILDEVATFAPKYTVPGAENSR